jgi:hypothetical protein
MSVYLIKSLIAVPALGAGLAAFLSMMSLFGKAPDPQRDLTRLKRFHKICGWTFIALLVPLTVLGATIFARQGDGLPLRGVIHVVLAVTLIALLLQKVLVVRYYRQFLKQAEGLGIAIFSLTLIIVLITAGYFVLHGGR